MRIFGEKGELFLEWSAPLFFRVIEDGTAAEGLRDVALVVDGGGEISEGFAISFDVASEAVKAAEALEFFCVADLRGIERAAEHTERFIVCFEGNGEGVAVFAAVSEGEAGGVGKATRRAVDDFRDKGERLKGARAKTFHQ